MPKPIATITAMPTNLDVIKPLSAILVYNHVFSNKNEKREENVLTKFC